MKKTLTQLLAVTILWLIVLFLFIRFGGDGLVLYFELPPEADGMEVRFSPEGIVSLADSRILEEEQEVQLHFTALEQGRTEVTLVWEGLNEDSLYEREIAMTLSSLPFGILTDSITWNFTGWEYLVLCLTLYFLSVSVVLFFASRREQKRVFFSYRAIRLLGLAIFFFAVSFFRGEYLLAFLKGRNAGTVWTLLLGIASSAQTFVRWTSYVLAVFAVITALSNVVLMRHEGIRFANMLGIAVAAVIVGGAFIGISLSYSRLTFPMRNVLCNVYAGLFVYFECLLAATVVRAAEAGRHEPAYDKDYIIILGCRIRPDGTLYPLIRGRVDRAIEFAHMQAAVTGKRAVLVPSGGQGNDEPTSEAEAMAAYLRQCGVAEDELLIEKHSQTTKENLNFSRNLISSIQVTRDPVPSASGSVPSPPEKHSSDLSFDCGHSDPMCLNMTDTESGIIAEKDETRYGSHDGSSDASDTAPETVENSAMTDPKVAFSTSSYHVCRGGILAEEMGWNIDGMGSRTKWYFWPNAFLREFIGLLAESWIQQLVAAGVIAALSALLTLII